MAYEELALAGENDGTTHDEFKNDAFATLEEILNATEGDLLPMQDVILSR